MPKAIIKISAALEITLERINDIDKEGMIEMEERLDLVRFSDRLVKLINADVKEVILTEDEQDMLGIIY